MATKAYFMINIAEESCLDGYQEIIRDLEALPEVKAIEPVRGWCDLLVQVEAPIRVIIVAHKIMAKKWVKHLSYLTADPSQNNRHERLPHEVLRSPKVALAKRADPVWV